jgi:TRAP transporter TAXI family solute receptor
MVLKLGRRLIVLVAVGMALLSSAPARAQNPIVPMLLCPFGCGNTEGYSVLGNLIARGNEPITLAPQETPGYMYNIRAMAEQRRWKNTVFGTEDTIVLLAPKGGREEIKEFLPEPVTVPFKLLFGESFWGQGKYFVSFDPNIKTPADLKGKRIALGLRTQSDWGFFARLILEYGYGVTTKNSDIRHVTPDGAIQQLIDGNADAAVAAFGTNPSFKEWLVGPTLRKLEATGRKVNYVGVDQAAIDKVNKQWNTGFLNVTVPAGTLPLQEKPFMSALNRGYMAASPELPDDVAYHLVKAVAKYGLEMAKLNALWKLWSPEMMLHGLSEDNVHPGAKKAHVELGWWDMHKKYPPVIFAEK